MLALTSLADAQFLGLRPAALQSDASDVGAKFTSGAHRHFVPPDDGSLRAAMALTTGLGAAWAQARWGGAQAWLVFTPLVLAALWGATESALQLLPNLM